MEINLTEKSMYPPCFIRCQSRKNYIMVADSGSGAARCQGCAWEGAMDMSCALMLVSVAQPYRQQ